MQLKYMILSLLLLSNLAIADLKKDTITTDEVIITASRSPLLYSETGRTINTITQKEIHNLPYLNAQDVLKKSFNIDVRQRGNYGVQADLSIRGGNADQVLILLNGINISDPQSGHHNMNLPIDYSSISKIEVMEGSGSRIYGAGAFAGVINFITDEQNKNENNFNLILGGDNYWSASANTAFTYKDFSSYFTISKSKSDGYAANTDFQSFNLFYHGKLKINTANIELQFGFTDKAFGANSFYTPEFPNQYEKTKTSFVSAKYDNGKENRTTIEVYARENQDQYRLFRDSMPDWYKSHNYHLTDVIGYNQKHTLVSFAGITNVGFTFKSEEIMSNVMGNAMQPVKVTGESFKFYTKSAFRLVQSYFIEHNLSLGNLSVSAGVSITGLRKYDWMIDPGVDFNFKIVDNFSIYANINSAHRLPTFTDLFYTDTVSLGNKDLKPEEALSYEIGSKYMNDFIKIQVAIFKRFGKNTIDWIKAEGDSLWRSINLTEVNSMGGEVFLTFYPKELFGINSFFDRIDFSYCYNTVENNTGYVLSEYVLNYLNHKANLSINHKLPLNLQMGWSFSYNARTGKYYEYSSKTIKDFDPYFLVDARISYDFDFATCYLQGKNLFNSNYIDISNVILPGRWIGIGISGKIQHSK